MCQKYGLVAEISQKFDYKIKIWISGWSGQTFSV